MLILSVVCIIVMTKIASNRFTVFFSANHPSLVRMRCNGWSFLAGFKCFLFPSVLSHCLFVRRKGIWPVKWKEQTKMNWLNHEKQPLKGKQLWWWWWYRPWKVMEFYCSNLRLWKVLEKWHRSWKSSNVLELYTSGSGIFSSRLNIR